MLANNIAGVINEYPIMSKAAHNIEGTVKKGNDGLELVAFTNKAFSQVAESSQKVGKLLAEISEASILKVYYNSSKRQTAWK
jgi:methyl-accepting chemotaxis protein